MQKVVYRIIEFRQYTPPNIEDDDYFHKKMNNVLVIYNLMSTADNSRKIADLFTDLCRSLISTRIFMRAKTPHKEESVITWSCLITLLRNYQSTLARQMYPKHTDVFMKLFIEGFRRHHGFISVYLKPSTHEEVRLKADVKFSVNPTEPPKLKVISKELGPVNQMVERQTKAIKTEISKS